MHKQTKSYVFKPDIVSFCKSCLQFNSWYQVDGSIKSETHQPIFPHCYWFITALMSSYYHVYVKILHKYHFIILLVAGYCLKYTILVTLFVNGFDSYVILTAIHPHQQCFFLLIIICLNRRVAFCEFYLQDAKTTCLQYQTAGHYFNISCTSCSHSPWKNSNINTQLPTLNF